MVTYSSEGKKPVAGVAPRPASSPRGLLLKCLLAGTVALLSAEGLMRAYLAFRGWTANCYAAQLELFRPQAQTGHDLTPGFRLKSSVYQISINSLGLRGPEITRSKPEGVRRIVLVGESSAFGYLVSDGQEAARLLEKELRERGHNVEVANGAVPGYNLFQSVVRFREVLAPLEPDLVIAYLGWNDLPYVVSDEPAADRFRRRSVADAWERLLGHSTLYGFVVYRLWGGPVRMVPADFADSGVTPAGERQFLENLAALASEVEQTGAELVICAQATAAHPSVAADLRPALGPDEVKQARAIELGGWLHRTLADFAAERHLAFIDAYSKIPPTAKMLGDYVHLTARGERRLAQLWTEAIEAGATAHE
ncbi:MAG TPA: GDSL-type esterase/lipase family protein [Pirellulales bacterium]|jgi:lysophospholipase L1-like esterase|nr:GDSL-type esterase/lipase family protein [Pirellulales bacterium]